MMHSLFSIALAAVITFWNGPLTIASIWRTFPLAPLLQETAVLPGLQGVFTGTPPENIGIHDGQLAPCPPSPNCVVSQNADADHAIAPISYQTDRDTAREALLKVLTGIPRTEVITQTDNYIRVEFTSRFMGFVDDGEFYLPADENVIQVRSAARLGKSDLGVNRRRLEQIRSAMKDLSASTSVVIAYAASSGSNWGSDNSHMDNTIPLVDQGVTGCTDN